MLTKYIEQAMRLAHYEAMENGRFFGSIPKCKGAWAESRTLEDCRQELRDVLEDWILLGLQLGHRLPVIAGINLNSESAPRRHRLVPHEARPATSRHLRTGVGQVVNVAPLSRELIDGGITDNSRVTVEFKKGNLLFEAKAAKK
jgi:predicted RNase H-like HicB family nuclease